MRYDLKGHFYVMKKFYDLFTFRPSGLVITLTYILMQIGNSKKKKSWLFLSTHIVNKPIITALPLHNPHQIELDI